MNCTPYIQYFATGFLCLWGSLALAQSDNLPVRVPEPQAIPQGTTTYAATPPSTESFQTYAFGVENPFKADTSTAGRDAAMAGIPINKLNVTSQKKVQAVLKKMTMYRRLPIQVVPCEEDLFQFVSQHPDVVTNIWEVMEISKIRVQELGQDRFYMEDGAGTRGVIECLYRGERYLLIHVLGTYEGAPFPNQVKGSGLIILQQAPTVGTGGQPQLAIRLDAFMSIENAGVDALARTFQPLVGRVADHNFHQTAAFMAVLSRTVCYNGEGMKQLSERLDKVRPEVRNEFGDLSLRITQRIADSLRRTESDLPLPLKTANLNDTPME